MFTDAGEGTVAALSRAASSFAAKVGLRSGTAVLAASTLRLGGPQLRRAYATLHSGGSSLTTTGFSLRSAACIHMRARFVRTTFSFGLVRLRAQRMASSA